MWNPANGDARVLWQTRPAGAPRAGSLRSTPCIARAGWGGTGAGPAGLAALLTEYDDVFRLAVGPEPLVRGALAALAPLGRMRGYGPP